MWILTNAFKVLFAVAAALSVASGLLVAASLFIAERRPVSGTFLAIHLTVGAAFLLLALLVGGTLVQVVAIARIADDPNSAPDGALRSSVISLLTLLVVSALAMCGILAIITYAILARIDQGFAVFG